MAKKNRLEGKFIIAFNTLIDGDICATDEKGNPDPVLYASEDDAMVELFDDALSMLANRTVKERKELGIKPSLFAKMKHKMTAQEMKKFLEENPTCNYNEEWVAKADEFIFGRKLIYTKDGLQIIGKKLK